jgi:hypothetical protein
MPIFSGLKNGHRYIRLIVLEGYQIQSIVAAPVSFVTIKENILGTKRFDL